MASKNKFLKELKKDPMAVTYVWMSDIHLNCIKNDHAKKWAQYVYRQAQHAGAQGVIITGDISEAPELVGHLKLLSKQIGLPIYFILGNHDYWGSDRQTTQEAMKRLTESHDKLNWLGCMEPVAITEKTCLIGTDGWYDCYAGEWRNSPFQMRDWDTVHDFRPIRWNLSVVIGMCRKFAGEAVEHLEGQIDKAIAANYGTIAIATHIPPFADASRYMGQPSQPAAAPFYSCPTMGDMILLKAGEHPDKKFVVLAGHTHDPCKYEAAPNVTCYVAAADYGAPSFQIIYIG